MFISLYKRIQLPIKVFVGACPSYESDSTPHKVMQLGSDVVRANGMFLALIGMIGVEQTVECSSAATDQFNWRSLVHSDLVFGKK